MTGIPVGSSVTFKELEKPALPTGWAWNVETISDDQIDITVPCLPPGGGQSGGGGGIGGGGGGIGGGGGGLRLAASDATAVAATAEDCPRAVAVTVTNTYSRQLAGFSVTKSVTGTDAAVAVVDDLVFEVTYTVDGEAAAEPLRVWDGHTATVSGLPVGAEVTVTEIARTLGGVTFGEPVFTIDGEVTDTFVVEADTTIAVGLENPVTQNPGGFTLTKTVTGTPAAVTAVGNNEFTVTYTVNGEPASTPLVVSNGSFAGVAALPAGSVVVLTEVVPAVPGVVFGAPVFRVDGVLTNTLTVGSGTGGGGGAREPGVPDAGDSAPDRPADRPAVRAAVDPAGNDPAGNDPAAAVGPADDDAVALVDPRAALRAADDAAVEPAAPERDGSR